MKKTVIAVSLSWVIAVFTGCSTVPITGRKQLKLVPEQQILAQSAASYRQVVAEGPLSGDAQQTALVRRVGQRISTAVEHYFRQQGQSDLLNGFKWEFNLIDQKVPNAWCMPGGKVVFYTGILPFTQDEAGLAAVMGHEIAHAVVGHGAERVSHLLLQQGGGYLLSLWSKESDYHTAIMQAYGLGSQLGAILPYSRLHESEADRLGLIFMAMAGYDPSAAVGFWQRMAAAGSGSPIEFLSTHPSDARRIRELQRHMPEALAIYNRTGRP